jgi:hypothetical protein
MALKLHLTANRYARCVQEGLLPRVSEHWAFRRRDAEAETVLEGWTDDAGQSARRADAARQIAGVIGDGTWGRLQRTVLETNLRDDGATAGGFR